MRCKKCGRLTPASVRLCPQCAKAPARRPYGARPSGTGPQQPPPTVRCPMPPGCSSDYRPASSAYAGRAARVKAPSAAREFRAPRRRTGKVFLICLALLCACVLTGYLLMKPTGGDPARQDTQDPVVSQDQTPPSGVSSIRAEAEKLIPHFDLRWYLQQLDDAMLENFCAFYRAVMDFQEEVTFPNSVTQRDIDLFCFLLPYECPEVFQLAQDGYGTTHSTNGVIQYFAINYGMRKDDYNTYAEQCAEIARKAAAQAQGLSEWERELAAIRYLNANCVYDADAVNSWNAYGSLVTGVAKCGGISLGFKWIAEEMGLTTFLLCGDARDGGDGHAWNCIRIDGAYSDVDVTAEVGFPNESRECAFRCCNVLRQRVAAPYILWEDITDNFTLPEAATMDGSYYARMGCYVRAGESPDPWLQELFSQVEREGSGSLALQFESQADYEAVSDAFAQAVNGLPFSVSYSGWKSDDHLWWRESVSRT